MKKTFVLLWCTLLGCSIIPDDAYEDVPQATLNKITVASNANGEGLSSQTTSGEVTYSGSRMTVKWTGELDPFWFVTRIDKIDYDFNEKKLLSKITITFVNGGTQTEEFSYNEKNNLLKAVTKYTGYVGTSDFFYKNNELDSIAKKTVEGANEYTGFFKRYYEGDPQDPYNWSNYFDYFYSIFPYDQNFPPTANIYFGCTQVYSSNPNDFFLSKYELRKENFATTYRYASVIPENRVESSEISHFYSLHTHIGKPNSLMFTVAGCNETPASISYYRLLPEFNNNYKILEMLNVAEERWWINRQPARVSSYQSLYLDFQYTISK